jgi:pyruvate/2-oxoglutarate dehydrogenase complex dihydrolipoamide acyltransferase (E2) component
MPSRNFASCLVLAAFVAATSGAVAQAPAKPAAATPAAAAGLFVPRGARAVSSDGTEVGAVVGIGPNGSIIAPDKKIIVWSGRDAYNRDVPATGLKVDGKTVRLPMTAKQFFAIKGR